MLEYKATTSYINANPLGKTMADSLYHMIHATMEVEFCEAEPAMRLLEKLERMLVDDYGFTQGHAGIITML
jgi:hypothetical protein